MCTPIYCELNLEYLNNCKNLKISVIYVQSDVRMRIAGAGQVPDKPVVIVYKCVFVCHLGSPSGVSQTSL